MYLGIDIGSVSANAVLIDRSGRILDYEIIPSGYDHASAAGQLLQALLTRRGAEPGDIRATVGTGYGRARIPGCTRTMTEITCHCAGVRHLFPDVQYIIDIGGQDSKAIRLDGQGYVSNFYMNDKCSAGTGRFLEVMSGIMNMDLKEFSGYGLGAKRPHRISSICTVFAESEVISALAGGAERRDIIAGIHEAIVTRVLAMADGASPEIPAVLTGGVAKNDGVFAAMKVKLPTLRRPEEPQITGALGAALMAVEYE